jgi:ribosomal protein S18 acetylase RimI-like enzyme
VRGEEEAHVRNATVKEVVRFARRLTVPDVVLRAGSAAVRVRPWPADAATAQVVPVPGAHLPSAQEVVRWLSGLSHLGYRRVRTAALMPRDQKPYREAGLDPLEELVLLQRGLAGDLPSTTRDVHRLARRDWALLPGIDAAAFGDQWHLDQDAIVDACQATPHHRLRVGHDRDRRPVAYVVHGRAGRTGYVQRLAVQPEHAGRGLGAALVTDGLRWMRRHGCGDALVNTHVGNDRARRLYEQLGFETLPDGLVILGRALQGTGS